MRAKFIGKNKSMGYKNGRVYELATTDCGKFFWVVDINGVGRPTPYTSMKTLQENWEILRAKSGTPEYLWFKEEEYYHRNNM